MSLFSDLSSWLFPKPRKQAGFRQQTGKRRPTSGKGDPRLMLARKQRALAEDMERLVQALDARISDVADKLHEADDRTLPREACLIGKAQDELRLGIRRLEATVKTKKELDRELADWAARKDDGPLDADHPCVRAEIVRSELAVRCMGDKRETKTVGAPAPKAAFVGKPEEVRPENRPTTVKLEKTDTFNILRAIREATREAERWHAVPVEDQDHEAILQLRHLRDLHAVLKRLDREQGVMRDRVALAVSPQP